MIEIGAGTHAIAGFGPPGKTFQQAAEDLAAAGYQHLMLLASETGPALDASGYAPKAYINLVGSDVKIVARTLAGYGLRVSCVYPGFPLDYAPENISSMIERFKQYRDIAWELGCHTLINAGGGAPKAFTPLEEKRETLLRVAEVMNAVACDTPGQLFKVAVDVHYHAMIERIADLEFLFDNMSNSNAGVCLNMGHLATVGDPGWELLARRPERVHVLAWKDHKHVADGGKHPFKSGQLGTGDTPLPEYAKVLKTVDCDAIHLITVEDVAFEERNGVMKRSRDYLMKLLCR